MDRCWYQNIIYLCNMIFAIFITIGGFIVQMIVALLNTLGWQFPTQIISAFATLKTILSILYGFLPFIGTIIAIFLILIPAHIVRYIFNIILWLWSMIPWIGKTTAYPSMKPLDLRSNSSGRNTLDLRRGAVKSTRARMGKDIR